MLGWLRGFLTQELNFLWQKNRYNVLTLTRIYNCGTLVHVVNNFLRKPSGQYCRGTIIRRALLSRPKPTLFTTYLFPWLCLFQLEWFLLMVKKFFHVLLLEQKGIVNLTSTLLMYRVFG